MVTRFRSRQKPQKSIGGAALELAEIFVIRTLAQLNTIEDYIVLPLLGVGCGSGKNV